MSSNQLPLDKIAETLEITIRRCAKSCPNCIKFDQTNDADICKEFKQRPPARVIVAGCDWYKPVGESGRQSFADDDIPF